MRLLLDTHIVLWAMADDARLPVPLRDAITGAETLFISAATVWEVAIKRALGKLAVPDDLFDRALAAGARPMPIGWIHAQAAARLPLHHADPFDRMLIAQARTEAMTLVSMDRQFAAYEVTLLNG